MCRIILVFIASLVSCSHGQKPTKTPQEYKFYKNISSKEYSLDSVKISNLLNEMVTKYEFFFHSYSPDYVDTLKSKVLIDTLLFDNSNNKIFILLTVEATKFEFRKSFGNEIKVLKNVTIYDGMGVIAKRKINSSFVFNSYGIEVGNYESLKECKRRLREIYFSEIKSFNMSDYNQYNIDDKRMWNAPMWDNF